jgi:uncharacterized protein (DUF362 family)
MKIDSTRRRFLRDSALFAATLVSGSASGALFRDARADDGSTETPDLTIAKGEDPAKNALAAVAALGGFTRFVHPGDKVVIKPNPIGTSPPDRALNTHPDMLEAVVRECLRAGAKEVVALSHDEMRSMEINGTKAAVERAGGRLRALGSMEEFREVLVPRGRVLRRVHLAADILDADVFINMPIAKHHGGSQVTFTMKNLMGVNWDRNYFHATDLQRCIAELATAVPHTLVIMDANHVLLTNGPAGPGEVLRAKQVVASTDPVAVDAYATRFFGIDPGDVGHIRTAYDLGVGEIDLSKLRVREVET